MQQDSIYFVIFLLFPLSALANAEEDIVGDILEKEGIPRNPPEQDTTGSISSFSEAPITVNETNQTNSNTNNATCAVIDVYTQTCIEYE